LYLARTQTDPYPSLDGVIPTKNGVAIPTFGEVVIKFGILIPLF